jgi:hypothetical protein
MNAVVRKAARVQHRPAPRSNERRLVIQHPRRQVLSLAAGAAALPAVYNATLYEKASFDSIRDIALPGRFSMITGWPRRSTGTGCRYRPLSPRYGGESINSDQNGSRVHRLC